jgi:hypothetical protein
MVLENFNLDRLQGIAWLSSSCLGTIKSCLRNLSDCDLETTLEGHRRKARCGHIPAML